MSNTIWRKCCPYCNKEMKVMVSTSGADVVGVLTSSIKNTEQKAFPNSLKPK